MDDMTDVLVLGPEDYLIFETDQRDVPPERFEDIRLGIAETFGVHPDRIVILTNLHARVLRKEQTT